MNDLELVELAARRTASALKDAVRLTESERFNAFADQLAKVIKDHKRE